jgi:hypothetical protein
VGKPLMRKSEDWQLLGSIRVAVAAWLRTFICFWIVGGLLAIARTSPRRFLFSDGLRFGAKRLSGRFSGLRTLRNLRARRMYDALWNSTCHPATKPTTSSRAILLPSSCRFVPAYVSGFSFYAGESRPRVVSHHQAGGVVSEHTLALLRGALPRRSLLRLGRDVESLVACLVCFF